MPASASASFGALGTTAYVAVTEAERLPPARAAVQATVAAYDLACSRFREDSELSALNRASGARIAVGELLYRAIEQALRAARITGGAVDPTVGGALVALGYDRDFDELGARPRGSIRFEPVPGWRTVVLDPETRSVRTARGVAIDLGATAKAQAADDAATAASVAAGCGVLVGLGGDFRAAGEAPAAGWRIRVTDDHRAGADAPGQWISIAGGGLATSSTTVRRWATAAGDMHHLLDPASGRPVTSPWRTVTVAAASCLDANIASTAAIVRGADAAGWLDGLDLPARLVDRSGRVSHVGGWPRHGDDLARSEAA